MDDRERLKAIEAYCKQYPRRYCRTVTASFFPAGWDSTAPPEPEPEPEPPPVTSPSLPPAVKTGWTRVIDSRFDTDGVLPHPWEALGGFVFRQSGSRPEPKHVSVSGGCLRLLMRWNDVGWGGPGWYTGYVAVKRAYRVAPFASKDQCVTIRYRIQVNGVRGHSNVPMRWPAAFVSHPNTQGEEDCWEGSSMSGATTFLHYTNPDGTAGRVSRTFSGVDMSQFHVFRFERRSYHFRVYVDNMDVAVWDYAGNATSLPDYPKIPLLQQESKTFHEAGSGGQAKSSGTEEIVIDWITVDNPV